MPPKKASKKKEGGRGGPQEVSSERVVASGFCLCHNDMQVRCEVCMVQPVPEVAMLDVKDEVEIQLAEVEKAAETLLCPHCKDAAMVTLETVTDVFLVSGIEESIPSALDKPSESESKSSKKKKKPATQSSESATNAPNPNESELDVVPSTNDFHGIDPALKSVPTADASATPGSNVRRDGRTMVRIFSSKKDMDSVKNLHFRVGSAKDAKKLLLKATSDVLPKESLAHSNEGEAALLLAAMESLNVGDNITELPLDATEMEGDLVDQVSENINEREVERLKSLREALSAEGVDVPRDLPQLEPSPFPENAIPVDFANIMPGLPELGIEMKKSEGIRSIQVEEDLFEISEQCLSIAERMAYRRNRLENLGELSGVTSIMNALQRRTDNGEKSDFEPYLPSLQHVLEAEKQEWEEAQKAFEMIQFALPVAVRLAVKRMSEGRHKVALDQYKHLWRLVSEFEASSTQLVRDVALIFGENVRMKIALVLVGTIVDNFEKQTVGDPTSETASSPEPEVKDKTPGPAKIPSKGAPVGGTKRKGGEAGLIDAEIKRPPLPVEDFFLMSFVALQRLRVLLEIEHCCTVFLLGIRGVISELAFFESRGFTDPLGKNAKQYFDLEPALNLLQSYMSITRAVETMKGLMDAVDVNFLEQLTKSSKDLFDKYSRLVLPPSTVVSTLTATVEAEETTKKTKSQVQGIWQKVHARVSPMWKDGGDRVYSWMPVLKETLEMESQPVAGKRPLFKNGALKSSLTAVLTLVDPKCPVVADLKLEEVKEPTSKTKDAKVPVVPPPPRDYKIKFRDEAIKLGDLHLLAGIRERFFPAWTKLLWLFAKLDALRIQSGRLKLTASEVIQKNHEFQDQALLDPLWDFLVFGNMVERILATNPSFGCVRSCSGDAECTKETGIRGAKNLLARVLAVKVKSFVEEKALLSMERELEDKERKKREVQDRKKQEEKERREREREEKERLDREKKQKEADEMEKKRLEKEEEERAEREKRQKELATLERLQEEERRIKAEIREKALMEKRQREEEERRRRAEASKWICAVCTLENLGNTDVCTACDSMKGTVLNFETPAVEEEVEVVPEVHPEEVEEEEAVDEGDLQPPAVEPITLDQLNPPIVAPVASSSPLPPRGPTPAFNLEEENSIGQATGASLDLMTAAATAAAAKVKGLSNATGENSCFLNVVVQSLWHLRSFSSEFMRASPFDHHCLREENQSCLVCSLRSTFANLEADQDSLVSSVEMRRALADAFGHLFVLGEKQDAGEALESMLRVLHQAQQPHQYHHIAGDESRCPCHVHRCLGSSFFEGVQCSKCRRAIAEGKFDVENHAQAFLDHRRFKRIPSNRAFSCFVRYVQASLIAELTGDFQERLGVALDVEPISCPVCDKKELDVDRFLTKLPSVYTIGVVWTSHRVADEDLKKFLESISEHLDLCTFEGHVITDNNQPISQQLVVLRGMMCYYGSHYAAYFKPAKEFNPEEIWYMFDDSTVKPVGCTWVDVARHCLASKFQPVVLFYETDASLNPYMCSFSGVQL